MPFEVGGRIFHRLPFQGDCLYKIHSAPLGEFFISINIFLDRDQFFHCLGVLEADWLEISLWRHSRCFLYGL